MVNKAVDEWLEYKEVKCCHKTWERSAETILLEDHGSNEALGQNCIKINVGCVTNKNKLKSGKSLAIFSNTGILASLWTEGRHYSWDSDLLDAEIIRKALILAKDKGWNRVVIQSSNLD
ncbi:hypothetical protein ACH5RR_033777 [Cinchona calisaya]|uniref:RNase H type-1 domain-containing protein n=1 Tax=Cinchona calisaya TaxID=153742 RepID=A0ABD2YB73_9GENT